MIKKINFIFLLIFSLNFYAQTDFEKGYYIDNNNVKTECFIRNEDWKSNPEQITCKNSDQTNEFYKNIKTIKEFGVGDFQKYKRYETLIDTSSVNINKYSQNAEPEWKSKTVFLKFIIEGEYCLLRYEDVNLKLFFYTHNGSNAEQLIHKTYLEEDFYTKKNNFFQRQLFSKAKCETTSYQELLKLGYNQTELSKYFLSINLCNDKKSTTTDYRNKQNNNKFNLNLKVSANSSSLSREKITPSQVTPNVDFGNKNTYGIGFEVEYVLPYNNNKWSIYFEPTYKTKYETYKTVIAGQGGFEYPQNWFVSYKSLDIALGFRHYMYISKSSKLFLNSSYVFNPKLSSKLINNTKQEEFIINSSTSYNLGLGFNYNKKYSFEFRYSNNLKNEYSDFYTKFKTLSMVLGYTVFEKNKNNKTQ